MAYDEDLAERARELVAGAGPVTEQKMFGGLAFLVGGHLAVAVSGEGGLMVRVAPDEAEQLLATTGADQVVMRGSPMRGWLRVPDGELATEAALRTWVERGVARAGSLPPKGAKAARPPRRA